MKRIVYRRLGGLDGQSGAPRAAADEAAVQDSVAGDRLHAIDAGAVRRAESSRQAEVADISAG